MSYQNSVIYKIECNDINIKECYIGSTVNFVGRRHDHKKINNNPKSKQYNYKVYQFIRDNGGWKNWSIKSIINYPCNSRKELILKEQEILETYDNTLNMVSACRSKKQYNIDNVEKIKERNKQYYNDNAEKLNKKSRQYHIDNAEKIKEQKKQYYYDNTEKILQYKKQYYNDNLEKIKKRKSEKIHCDCGRWFTRASMSRHRKSKIHTDFLKNK